MNIQTLSEKIGDFGKDIRLNLQSVSTTEGTPGLTAEQSVGVMLSVAYALGNKDVIEAVIHEFTPSASVIEASKSAATIMAMNNVYYRFTHLSEDKEFSKMPAKLRMSIIGKPQVAKVDFELMSLAISAVAGCGACINSHIAEVKKSGISNEGVQSTIRIASILNATRTALSIN
jgi:alkyl hydroperoxide reductase subunit D